MAELSLALEQSVDKIDRFLFELVKSFKHDAVLIVSGIEPKTTRPGTIIMITDKNKYLSSKALNQVFNFNMNDFLILLNKDKI